MLLILNPTITESDPSQGGGGGGIALVQSKPGTTADGSAGLTVSFDTPVTAGNSVFACVSFDPAAGLDGVPVLAPGFVESTAEVVQGPGAGANTGIYAIHGVVGGETGVFFALDSAVRANLTILEFSGLADAAAEDTDTASSTGTEPAMNGLTPISPDNLSVAVLAYANAADDYTGGPTAGWTRIGTGVGGASVFQEVAILIQSAADATSTGWVLNNADAYAIAAAAFGGE